MPVQQSDKPEQQWQQCQRNDGNNTCVTTAKVPAQQQQWHHCNNSKEVSTINMMVPLQQWQRDQCNNVSPPLFVKHNELSSSLHPPPLCRSRRRLARHPPTAVTVFPFVIFVATSPTPFSCD
jgi:hypothetical protein